MDNLDKLNKIWKQHKMEWECKMTINPPIYPWDKEQFSAELVKTLIENTSLLSQENKEKLAIIMIEELTGMEHWREYMFFARAYKLYFTEDTVSYFHKGGGRAKYSNPLPLHWLPYIALAGKIFNQ